MSAFQPVVHQLWQHFEWMAIATHGPNGPHVVGTWGDVLRRINGDLTTTIAAPAGKFHQTETNLQFDNRVELLCATKAVVGARGPGQGCSFTGTAEVQTTGPYADKVRGLFPGVRGALVIHLVAAQIHL